MYCVRKNWGIYPAVVDSSDNVEESNVPAAEGRVRLVSIDIEWRF